MCDCHPSLSDKRRPEAGTQLTPYQLQTAVHLDRPEDTTPQPLQVGWPVIPPNKFLFSRVPPPIPLPPPHPTPPPRSQGGQAEDIREGRHNLTYTPNKVCSPGQELGFPRPYSPTTKYNCRWRSASPPPNPAEVTLGAAAGFGGSWRPTGAESCNSQIASFSSSLCVHTAAQRCRLQPPPSPPGLSSRQESSERSRGRSRVLATDPCGRRFAPFHREAGQIQSTDTGQLPRENVNTGPGDAESQGARLPRHRPLRASSSPGQSRRGGERSADPRGSGGRSWAGDSEPGSGRQGGCRLTQSCPQAFPSVKSK